VPLGRLGRTTDSAAVCGFLCSKEAAYITGEAWNVSGGEEYH
jgi:meso-butanediol dehydrogenase/(S,S)-butanediol dehydrogenase/diacetyl reductase